MTNIRMATVRQTDPLTIAFDGETTPSPATVMGGVTYTPIINGRVYAAMINKRPIIFGYVNG